MWKLLKFDQTIRNVKKSLLVALTVLALFSFLLINFHRDKITMTPTHDTACSGIKKPVCDVNSKPRKSIFYIKIHKTGSTTLRSTILQYGRTYNLTICMDATDMWGLNWPHNIDEIRLTKTREEKCEIVAEELVYRREIGKTILNGVKNTYLISRSINSFVIFVRL